VMSDIDQRAAGKAATDRYEALFRVAQTLISIRSSEELFKLLARELRAVVNFYVMGVGIYDEKAHEMHTTSYGEPGVPLQAPQFAPEETFSWWVYQQQQPLIIPFLDAETRFPAVAEMLKSRGVRSVCVLPLTTVHRRLGGLAIVKTVSVKGGKTLLTLSPTTSQSVNLPGIDGCWSPSNGLVTYTSDCRRPR
jgi:transcriptional regulator with GAF, ATPase, and Fis domain